MKITTSKTGAYVTFEKCAGWYAVRLVDSAGRLIDKIRCDSYRMACEYRRAFVAIARNE
jgi:hypothetical protein